MVLPIEQEGITSRVISQLCLDGPIGVHDFRSPVAHHHPQSCPGVGRDHGKDARWSGADLSKRLAPTPFLVEVYVKRAALRTLSGEPRIVEVRRKNQVPNQLSVIHIKRVGLGQLASYPSVTPSCIPRCQKRSDVTDKALMNLFCCFPRNDLALERRRQRIAKREPTITKKKMPHPRSLPEKHRHGLGVNRSASPEPALGARASDWLTLDAHLRHSV